MKQNMHIEFRKLQADELELFVELVSLFEEVFEMKEFRLPPRDHLQEILQDKTFHVFVAISDRKELLGGLTAYTLQQYYATKPLVYIYDLAVDSRHQRKGIGTKLIAAITSFCKAEGMQEVFVQADRVDEHAVDFYRKTGATEEDVLHFYYDLQA
jgi:ribosomal protein S18 acetylase RimI-like enzyme